MRTRPSSSKTTQPKDWVATALAGGGCTGSGGCEGAGWGVGAGPWAAGAGPSHSAAGRAAGEGA
eukprot:5713467-Alexandrium_andersonii.AAC.1